jgi:hypothetical protein
MFCISGNEFVKGHKIVYESMGKKIIINGYIITIDAIKSARKLFHPAINRKVFCSDMYVLLGYLEGGNAQKFITSFYNKEELVSILKLLKNLETTKYLSKL